MESSRGGLNAGERTRLVWIATAAVAVVVAVVVGVVLATASSPSTPASAPASASDRNASPALVAAADAVGFHPTTEPGVGQIEGKPVSAAHPASTPDLLAVGTLAPPFTLSTPQGERVSLAQERGKAVLLEFFATWCPHCNAEAPHLRTLSDSLPASSYAFLAINADGETAASVFAFHRYYGIRYPALLDPSSQPGSFSAPGAPGKVSTAYRVASYPTFYVLDARGRVSWSGDGEQPDALLLAELRRAARRGN